MKLNISRNQVAGEYNFVADPTNGAVGVIALDIVLPVFSKISGFRVCTLTRLTGGATLSFGIRQIGVAVPTTIPAALTPVCSLAALNAVDVNGNFIPLNFFNFATNPVKFLTDWEIVMAISGAPLTGGRIEVESEYTLMNL